MKINSNRENEEKKMADLSEAFAKLQSEYSTLYVYQLENQVFIYRPLGRAEFKRLVEDERFSDIEKEDIICEACILYPEGYDFDDCEAGVPTTLSKMILKNSFLDSLESRKLVIAKSRQEMFDLDNQVTCIINEAFPQFDIEEIEQWDLAKTAKYLSRAEWKLVNLRGLNMDTSMMDEPQEQQTQTPAQRQDVQTEEIDENPIRHGKIETIEERQERLTKKGGKKERMTPEKLAELRAKYPEMEWGDNVFDELSVDKFKDSIDVSSPALRTGW